MTPRWAACCARAAGRPSRSPTTRPCTARRLRGGKAARHPAWLGSAVDLPTLRATADAAGLDVERTANEGTQYCLVALRRR